LKDENIPLSKTSIRVERGLLYRKRKYKFITKYLNKELESPAILISSGRTEAAIKYKELIFITMATLYIHEGRVCLAE
jgi:hypothetical protein